MGRYVSLAIEPTVYFGIRDVKPGYGSGAFRFYGSSGTFTVPNGVTEVRVTALGGGGSGSYPCVCCNCWCCCTYYGGSGGGGAGYIVATIPVTPGCVCNIAVGGAGGGNSCFGTVLYAYGGCNASTTQSSTSAGAGGTYCLVPGSGTLVSAYCGNAGLPMTHSPQYTCQGCLCQAGGASGSPLGGNSCGQWPGAYGTDVYSCKGFNGESSPESDVASKFGNTIRWPGEAILSTHRSATVISGTAPGFPPSCYCVSTFGGAVSGLCSASNIGAYTSAGCGGGGAGYTPPCIFRCYYNYGSNMCCCPTCLAPGNAGNGFVVVEY